jgi:hypothetical protein
MLHDACAASIKRRIEGRVNGLRQDSVVAGDNQLGPNPDNAIKLLLCRKVKGFL